jgi:O-antigen/teichoic acid export membrane protein
MKLSRATGTSRRTVGAVIASAALRFGVSAPLTIIILPVALRRLSTAEYGVWAVLSVFLAIGYFAEAGIRTEMIRRIARARSLDDVGGIAKTVREGTVLLGILAVVVSSLGIGFSPALVHVFFHGHHGVPPGVDAVVVCRLVMVLLALSLITAGAFAALEGVQRSDWDNYAVAIGNVVGAALSLTGLLIHWGLWAFVVGAFTQLLVSSLVRAFAMRVVMPDVPISAARISVTALRSYLGISSLVVLSQVSNVFDYEFDKVLLARYVTSATAGMYDIGSSLALQARAVVLLPLLVLLPGVAELAHRQDGRALALFVGVRQAIAAGLILLIGGVVVLGPAIVDVWIGHGHGQAGVSAQWLAGAMALNCIGAPAACYVIANGWTKITAISSVVNIVVNSVTSLVLTQTYGLHGALIGSLAANAAATLVFLVMAARREAQLSLSAWLRPAVCGVAAVVIAELLGVGHHVGGWLPLCERSVIWLVLATIAIAASGTMRPLLAVGRNLADEQRATASEDPAR